MKHGIKKDQYIRFGGNGLVFILGIQTWTKTRASGDMSARRTAAADDSVGINAQHGGILANPTDGTLRIFDTRIGRNAVTRFHTVIGTEGDHATFSKVIGLRLEL